MYNQHTTITTTHKHPSTLTCVSKLHTPNSSFYSMTIHKEPNWWESTSPTLHKYMHIPLPTHRCSLHGRCRCTLPLCGRTPPHSGRGWSNTGWSPSRSNHPWIQLGSGSAGLRWGGWAETRWRARRWKGRSCWSAARRCTSCSSGTAHAGKRCRRTGEPGVTEGGWALVVTVTNVVAVTWKQWLTVEGVDGVPKASAALVFTAQHTFP